MSKYRFKTEPYEHQKEALRRGWNKPYFGYLMEMGTGKTKVTIDNAAILYEYGRIDSLVVAAPKGVYENWIGEIETHMPDRLKYRIVSWNSTLTQRFKQSFEKTAKHTGMAIFLINIESLNTSNAKRYLRGWLKYRKALFAIDESTKIKNHKAARSKAAVEMGTLAPYRRILTGYVVPNTPMDIYGQSLFLRQGLLANSEGGFKQQYCVVKKLKVDGTDKRTGKPRQYTVETIVGTRNMETLQERLKEFTYRVRKEDCLDLPDKIYTTRDVDLTLEQIKVYDDLKKQAYHQFEDGSEVTPQQAITLMLRLHQVVCGALKTDEGDIQLIESNRIKVLLDILEETEGKVVIWANYIHDIVTIEKSIQEAYGAAAVVSYYGATERSARLAAVQAIQNGPARFFIGGEPASRGITLTAANTHIYYSNTYDLEVRVQSEDRSHRIGQKNPVTYIDMVSRGTVDEQILRALRKKIDVASAIQEDGFQKWVI